MAAEDSLDARGGDLAGSPSDRATDVRDVIMGVAVAGGVVLSALTEALGLGHVLSFGPVLVAWVTVLAAALLLVGRRRPRWRGTPALRPGLDLAMLGWIGAIAASTGALALLTAPTTWDSMSYHLPRVAHWAQNRSVAFYPTHVIRQIYQPPWAEWAILHLYVLAGGDRLANLVQWASMVGSVIGVSVVARQLGAGRRGQILAAFACATIPMGVKQAATTQNDYVVALWLVCLVSALLRLAARPGAPAALFAGASLGLALLTKGTAYVYAAPFVAVFLATGRRRPVRARLGEVALVALVALALNAPQGFRNAQVFGSPLGPGAEGSFRYANDQLSVRIMASNVLRNAALHLGTPWAAANAGVERAVERLHDDIGIGPNDARSTWPTTRFSVGPPAAHEDLAGNGLHLVLIAAAVVAIAWRARRASRLAAYAGCLVLAFLLFCLLLRWQPWHSRLHLPLFALGTPLVGVVFARVRPLALGAIALLLAATSLYFLGREDARPGVDRLTAFTTPRAVQRAASAGPAWGEAARRVASRGCRDVGVALRGNDPEYFLWALLGDAGWRGRMEAVLVSNPSAELPYAGGATFRPCAIVRLDAEPTGGPGLVLAGQYYTPNWAQGGIEMLVPAPLPTADDLAGAGPPVARLLLEDGRYRLGEPATIGLLLRNPVGGAAADLHVGLILPDGKRAVFLGPAGALGDPVGLDDAGAFARARLAPPGFVVSTLDFATVTLPRSLPAGGYQLFVALVRPRAAGGGGIPAGDVLASDMRRVVFQP